MKDRDAMRKKDVEAGKVRVGQRIEVDGVRIRCDRKRKREHNRGRVTITQIPLGPSGRLRHMHLNPRRHVELIVR